MTLLSNPEKFLNSAQTNRVASRLMLQIIQKYGHIHNIPDLLFRDFKLWHKFLRKWINSKSYEDRIVGIQACHTFHQQISEVLQALENEDNRRVLLFFIKFFQDTLKSPNSQSHEIQIAIRGFGLMAAPCKLLVEPKYLSELFDLVMQRTEYSYHTSDRLKRREVLEQLPSYVESLSKIMSQLDEISGIQLQSLESIIVILMKDFHYLSKSHHSLVARSLFETFVNLQNLGKHSS
jgi:DNA-dependent protein kinase catalytic subunit